MNIFNKVALQGLKKNRTRTFVTVIGVALSAALITAIAIFAVSLQNYMVNGAIKKYGNWHIEFTNVDQTFIQKQADDKRVAKLSFFENIGYASLVGGKNPDKPYIFIAGFNKDSFDTLPINLLSGRLPENSNEILVPSHVSSNGGVKFTASDTLNVMVGTRQDGETTLNQYDTYRAGEETLIPVTEKIYTIVGIYQRPAFEDASAPGYTLITAVSISNSNDNFSAFLKLNNPNQIKTYIESGTEDNNYVLNNDVLRFMGISNDKLFNTLLYSVGSILIILVMINSIFLIYNSFNISLNERSRQFGILMSVGATEKQLRNSVLFEGLCIGTIGIPVGIVVGILSIQLVLSFVSKNFTNILYDNVPLTLNLSIPALAAAAVISMITILISAYLPARKAARTPVMECIRQTNEVKVESKEIKTSTFTEHLYGLEGTLALKNFKRNRRRYRSIILSLTLSVVLFVASNTFASTIRETSDQAKVVTDYDIGLGTSDMDDNQMLNLYDKLKNIQGITASSYQSVMEYSGTVQESELASDFRQAEEGSAMSETLELPLEIQFLDDNTYLQILKSLGLPVQEYSGENAKLIAIAKINDTNGQAENIKQLPNMFANPTADISIFPVADEQVDMKQGQNVSITCVEIVPPDTPPYTGTAPQEPYFFRIIAPWSLKEKLTPSGTNVDVKVKGMTFQSNTPSQSTVQIQKVIDGASITSNYNLYNIHELLDQSRNILFIVNLFAGVFIAMIALIGVANVFNTISTNIRLRRRELAMLRSVGMSEHDFNKMMRFECLLYGVRTLLFGLPISGILSWLIYKGMSLGGAAIDFTFPWTSIAISMIGVFIVIFITMLYSTSKIKKENIIDALRDDMT